MQKIHALDWRFSSPSLALNSLRVHLLARGARKTVDFEPLPQSGPSPSMQNVDLSSAFFGWGLAAQTSVWLVHEVLHRFVLLGMVTSSLRSRVAIKGHRHPPPGVLLCLHSLLLNFSAQALKFFFTREPKTKINKNKQLSN